MTWILLAGAVVAIVLFTCAACSSSPSADRSGSASVRDSAGIRIVENSAVSDVESGWSITAEPIFRIGWEEGDPEFESVYSGFIGGPHVVVGDRGTQLLHVFSLEGESLGEAGGPGEGPGEFGRIDAVLELDADTFLVADGRNLRVSTFSGTEFLGSTRFESFVGGAGYAPRGRFADGSWVLVPMIFALSMDAEPGWMSYPVLRTVDFATLDTVAVTPFFEMRARGDMNPITSSATVVPIGTDVVAARTDRPEIVWRDATGRITRIARWDAVPREATDADRDVWERAYRERSASRAGQPEYEETIQRMSDDFGGTLPLFETVIGDSRGNVWMEEADLSRSTSGTYHVVSDSGEWLGSVELPRPMWILDITHDRILGVETDDFDVQAVALYAIEK